VTFHLEACRFQLSARDAIQFPLGMAGNVLRGALGNALHQVACAEDYARIFEPGSFGNRPSGLSNWPRPFVLRVPELEGRTFEPDERFCFGLNLFDTRSGVLDQFTRAFSQWADLVSVERQPVAVDLSPRTAPVSRIRVAFQTPIELKANGQNAKGEFSVLLARARDRVSTLRSLYGAGPLEIDFRGLAERARSVKTLRCELRRIAVERRSSRTGQRHGIGGLIGFADYEGDLAEFLPYLEAAHWTGVGRHCTWGSGEITTTILDSGF
jgi:hypothetical protein